MNEVIARRVPYTVWSRFQVSTNSDSVMRRKVRDLWIHGESNLNVSFEEFCAIYESEPQLVSGEIVLATISPQDLGLDINNQSCVWLGKFYRAAKEHRLKPCSTRVIAEAFCSKANILAGASDMIFATIPPDASPYLFDCKIVGDGPTSGILFEKIFVGVTQYGLVKELRFFFCFSPEEK